MPPEEEVLAVKLITEHAEHWLRNEATTFFPTDVRYKNPFGNGMDGVFDANLTRLIGQGLLAVR